VLGEKLITQWAKKSPSLFVAEGRATLGDKFRDGVTGWNTFQLWYASMSHIQL